MENTSMRFYQQSHREDANKQCEGNVGIGVANPVVGLDVFSNDG
jgi:hypothetical protein